MESSREDPQALTAEPVERFASELRARGVAIVAGPGERDGATGKIQSVYFRDPDGNLVEAATCCRASHDLHRPGDRYPHGPETLST